MGEDNALLSERVSLFRSRITALRKSSGSAATIRVMVGGTSYFGFHTERQRPLETQIIRHEDIMKCQKIAPRHVPGFDEDIIWNSEAPGAKPHDGDLETVKDLSSKRESPLDCLRISKVVRSCASRSEVKHRGRACCARVLQGTVICR
jgi:hypothetical protein